MSEGDAAISDDPNMIAGMMRTPSQSSDWQLHRSSSQTEPFPPLPTGPPSISENQEFGDMASGRESNADEELDESQLTIGGSRPPANSGDTGK